MAEQQTQPDDVENPEQKAPAAEMEANKAEAASGGGSSSGLTWALGCGGCILVIGIIALVLYLLGYFEIKEPCVQVQSFVVRSMELGSGSQESAASNPLVGALDSITGGLASSVAAAAPTQATLHLDLVLEVNNTNSYKLNYKQLPGVEHAVKIPEYMLTASDPTEGPIASLRDFPVGEWNVEDGTLPKSSTSYIPVSVSAQMDLNNPEIVSLAPIILNGGKMAFLIFGGIEGSSWMPGLTGDVQFLCLAQVGDVTQFGQDAKIHCKTTLKIGDFLTQEGEIQARALQAAFLEQPPTDPSCHV